jgi:DnaK suppressor protein
MGARLLARGENPGPSRSAREQNRGAQVRRSARPSKDVDRVRERGEIDAYAGVKFDILARSFPDPWGVDAAFRRLILCGSQEGTQGAFIMTIKKSEAPKKSDLKRFKKILEDKREALVKAARESLQEDMTLDTNDLPDEMDLASSEYLQSFTFRLRGRERFFLDKIDQALKRIEDGSFGICESCEEPISIKRLEARPETTLCIRCKEDQERVERDFG